MKMNEAEDTKKESFKNVTVGFECGPLNFDYALTLGL
jgi:hypothetical protein